MIKQKSAYGFTLVEVLVALLVLGVGVLGFAGLQLQALKVTGEAYARDQASNLAVDLVERIRINKDELADDEYLNPNSWAVPADCAVLPVPFCATSDGAAAVRCDSRQMAAFDAFDVMCSATALMPNGLVFVDKYCGPGDFPGDPGASANPCIRVAWDNHEAWSGDGTLSGCRQQTNCVELEVIQ